MATKKRKAIRPRKPKKPKLDREDKDFFAKLGSRGGEANRDNHKRDKYYFTRLAILSHQRRRENKAQRLAESNGKATS